MLQFSGVPEIHFFLNPRPISVYGRGSELKFVRNLSRRVAATDQFQDFQFAVCQSIDRTRRALCTRWWSGFLKKPKSSYPRDRFLQSVPAGSLLTLRRPLDFL